MKTIKRLAVLAVLLMPFSCYHMRNARFADKSESEHTLWLCGEDDSAENPGGVACMDLKTVAQNHPEILLDFINATETPEVPKAPDPAHSKTEM